MYLINSIDGMVFMASLIKLSEGGALALHAGVYLAACGGVLCSARRMAAELKVSPAHLVKVLQRLEHAGLVRATRGPRGGYGLARPASRIRLQDLFEVLEGPLTPVSCLMRHTTCAGRPCVLGGLIQALNDQIIGYLSGTTLEALLDRGWRPNRPYRTNRRAVS